jgi:diguanylate cyclase (GGDEF)-like protein
VLLAVMLVTAIQLLTLLPTLRTVKAGLEGEADRRVELAGLNFDEYMQHRTELLTRMIDTVVWDYAFREAVATDDARTLESSLQNQAARMSAETAAVFDLDGVLRASVGGGRSLWPGAAMERLAADPNETGPVVAIGFVDGQPYHTVTLPVSVPVPIAWATFGLPIDAAFANEIAELTGLELSVVGFGVDRKQIHASTLDDGTVDAALVDVHLGGAELDDEASGGRDWITQLRPYREESDGVYVALQLSLTEALEPYRNLRTQLIVLAGVVLLLTLGTAIWLSRMVTRPVGQLVEAARRMAEGIYSQPLAVQSRDEFSVLAQGFNAMQRAIAKREQDIVHMAQHDSLSGLPTRDIIVSEIRHAISECEQLAVINFVLHRFDELASSLGHRTADRLIQLVAGRLRDRLERGQLLGHLNHPEFVIVLPEADLADAEAYVRELQTMLRAGLATGGANISLQLRAGVALYPEHGINASELLRCAGIARGQASHVQGSVGVYEPGQERRALELIRIVGDFPRALQQREIKVEFQPKIDCTSLELTGAEALVRWDHPELGRLPPGDFIEAIEQAGGISQLTRFVLEESVATIADWRARSLELPVSVNISADDLVDDGLLGALVDLSARFDIAPGLLTLEITESAIMRDVDHALAVVSSIRERGFRISIDDFGTGHSALAQLKRLPVDELKIDKSFVLNISDQRDEAVVRTAIELAHKFGLTAVAEGVENDACLTRLRQLGCETAQGFYFSRSLPADKFDAWARSWSQGEGADIVSLVDTATLPRMAG